MRKVEDGKVMSFREITSKYRHDYCVIEIVESDHSKGIQSGKVLWLCDNAQEAIETAYSNDDENIMMLPGVACYSEIGGAFVCKREK